MVMKRVIIGLCIVAVLFYVWPNVVHEPAHLLALRLQGSDGVIAFDWSGWPAHPSITRTAPVAGIAGGLLYVLMPSIVSVLLLIGIAFMRSARLLPLAMFLVMDLVANVMKARNPISDFHFLTALPMPSITTVALAVCIAIPGCFVIARLMQNEVRHVPA